MARGADILAERDEAMPILVDPATDLLGLGERRLSFSGGLSYVPDDSQRVSSLFAFLATHSFASLLPVVNDSTLARVVGVPRRISRRMEKVSPTTPTEWCPSRDTLSLT
jgi:hypothetical protein